MVDTQDLREIAPHYAVMLVLCFLAVAALRTAIQDVRLLLEFGVVLVIVFLYPFAVRRIGYAPDAWE